MGRPISSGRAVGRARRMLGLYLHIPFCSAICNYCNFNRGLFDGALKTRYVDALVREIRGAALKACATNDASAKARFSPAPSADTIYLGGRTPSLLEQEEISHIIAACKESFE